MMGVFEEVNDWFTSWLKSSKSKPKPKVEEARVEGKPRKPKPSPKTKSSEEIFKDFGWDKGPKYTFTYTGYKGQTTRKEPGYVDPNLLEGYRIFSLDETASKADIKSKYHALAKKYHPDYNKSPHAAESFINLKKWYEYLMSHHVQKRRP
jgi:preprotein translocase subunit Sec63